MIYFKDGFKKKWDLQEYHDLYSPAVFFGIYESVDYIKISNHKGPKIIVWGGGDMNPQQLKFIQQEIKKPNTFTFSPPGQHSEKLTQFKIKHKICYIPNKNYNTLPLTTLGENIYVYKGIHGNRSDHYKFNEIVSPLIDIFGKDRVIYTEFKPFKDLVKNYYQDCFVYVKPNEMAGCTTMYELAHMGRKTLGPSGVDLPFLKNYSNQKQLVNLIMEESKYIGKSRPEVRDSIENLFLNNEWLTLKFWKNE
jgi:hypothetical protein